MKKLNYFLTYILLFTVSITFMACSKPQYLEDQLSDKNEIVLEEDSYDKYSFLKKTNYRYATNNKGLFYISSGSNNIFYYDYSNGNSTVWCNKIACTHDDKSCSAYVADTFESEYVECYNGYVYKIDTDDNGMYLVRLNEDGSGEIRMANLFEGYPTGVHVDFGHIYDGKMYYFIKKDGQNMDVNCVDLSSQNKIERVFSLDYTDTALAASSMFINDQHIYISHSKSTDNGKTYSRKIYDYNRISGVLSEVGTSFEIESSCANDNIYYFTKNKSLYCINSSGETEVHPGLFEKLPSSDYSISCNQKYIVFHRDSVAALMGENVDIYVYDINKDTLNCIEEASVRAESDNMQEETNTLNQEVNGAQSFNSSKSKKFCFLEGLTGNYAFVTGLSTEEMYVLDLEKCKATTINIDIVKSFLPSDE